MASKRREIYQWCHLPDTLITMANGELKRISDVEPGDYVISHTGHHEGF